MYSCVQLKNVECILLSDNCYDSCGLIKLRLLPANLQGILSGDMRGFIVFIHLRVLKINKLNSTDSFYPWSYPHVEQMDVFMVAKVGNM